MSSNTTDWLTAFYDDVDNMRMDPMLDRFTDDAVVEFANNPPAHGKEQIRAALGGLWAAIAGLRHDIHERYDKPGCSLIEVTVTYRRKDGGLVPLPAASALMHRDGKVYKLKIYIDIAPLFAVEPANATAT